MDFSRAAPANYAPGFEPLDFSGAADDSEYGDKSEHNAWLSGVPIAVLRAGADVWCPTAGRNGPMQQRMMQ